MSIEIAPVEPTTENAEVIRHELALDFQRMGLSKDDAETRAFGLPGGIDLVEWQRQRLELNPQNYLGGYVGSRLMGAAHINEWKTGDQLPYAQNPFERLSLRLRSKSQPTNHVAGRPLGIHTLVFSDDRGQAMQDQLIDQTLKAVIEKARQDGTPEVRTQTYNGDPVRAQLFRSGFNEIAFGRPIADVEQALMVRAVDVEPRRVARQSQLGLSGIKGFALNSPRLGIA